MSSMNLIISKICMYVCSQTSIIRGTFEEYTSGLKTADNRGLTVLLK